jgi:hypothetical protein
MYSDYCNSCPYKNGNARAVETRAREISPISELLNGNRKLLIFQSPGAHEWEAGAPLANLTNGAGLRMRNAFIRNGMQISNFDITNSILCYQGPGANGRDRSISRIALRLCGARVNNVINSGSYTKIIVFGAAAKHQILDLGYQINPDNRFCFLPHPCGGLSNTQLDNALNSDAV